MFENINEVSVLVSAILAIAIGSIWYSPLLFGKYWMQAIGITEEDLESSKEKMALLTGVAFVVNLILLFVIAQFVVFTQTIGESLRVTGTLLTVLIGAVVASAVIWEQKSVSYLLINVGYAAVVVYGGMAVIWYWPW